MKRLLFLARGLFLLLAYCTSFVKPAVAQPERLTFCPHWIPQAQFAGYYVALDQGFYKQAGLDLQIIHPSASISAFDYLIGGKADIISTFLMDGLKQRLKGVPIVNIGQLSQHSALMMVAKKTKGIQETKDLDRKRLGIWSTGFEDIPLAMMEKYNYRMEMVPILNTINLFLMDGVDALTVMYYNEYDQIINSGINEDELTAFFFSRYGFDIPEDGLYCLEKTYATRQQALKKFVNATLKGWEYAAQHKDYTIDLVVGEMNRAHLPNNKAHQRWMLDKVLELIEPGSKDIRKGLLLKNDFESALQILKSGTTSEFKETELSLENFYKPLAD